MIGQSRLKNLVHSFTVESFPKSLLLVGEQGCGKHTFLKEVIQPHLDHIVQDITSTISFELLLNIALNTTPSIYLIDVDLITEKQQNILLKFVEEPPTNANIVLISSSLTNVIPTVQNRCVLWYFDSYSNEELENFTSDLTLLQYIRTPGKLQNTTISDVKSIEELCNKLFTQIDKASLSNLLTVSEKISWSDKIEGYDKDIFYDILLKTCLELFKERKVNIFAYRLTDSYVNEFKSKILFDRKRLFEKYLVELKYGCTS